MSKEELKNLHRLKKISTKEYFLELSNILKNECLVSVPVTIGSSKDVDFLAIFDGKLPL